MFLELKENFRADFRPKLNFGKLIGVGTSTNIITVSPYSHDKQDITNSIYKIIIHCSLLSDVFYNGNHKSDVLCMWDTPDLRIGYTFKIQRKNLKYHLINNNLIQKIKFEIKDSLNRYIEIKDPIRMTLFLRSFKNYII